MSCNSWLIFMSVYKVKTRLKKFFLVTIDIGMNVYNFIMKRLWIYALLKWKLNFSKRKAFWIFTVFVASYFKRQTWYFLETKIWNIDEIKKILKECSIIFYCILGDKAENLWISKEYCIQCCQNILYLKYYTLFWQNLRIILYSYFFQSNTLKILYYTIKLSKNIKST